MKNIAIIPARGGSKRIHRKNIKNFHGKPLICYSIEAALSSCLFDKVIVSTDDNEIAEIAKKSGAEIPFLRPKELSDDFTGTDAVLSHALAWFENQGEKFDYSCLIYATAPFLRVEFLKKAYQELKISNATRAFSATSMPFPIQRTFKVTEDGRCEMFWPENYTKRSQDLEEAYQDAGQFYWTKIQENLSRVMFDKNSIPVVLPRHLVQDIDTPEDWQRAEFMYEVIQKSQQ